MVLMVVTQSRRIKECDHLNQRQHHLHRYQRIPHLLSRGTCEDHTACIPVCRGSCHQWHACLICVVCGVWCDCFELVVVTDVDPRIVDSPGPEYVKNRDTVGNLNLPQLVLSRST